MNLTAFGFALICIAFEPILRVPDVRKNSFERYSELEIYRILSRLHPFF